MSDDKKSDGPANDNPHRRSSEMAAVAAGYSDAAEAAEHLLREPRPPISRRGAWGIATHWLEQGEHAASERPRAAASSGVATVRALMQRGLWVAYRSGFLAGLSGVLEHRFPSEAMLEAEARALGEARGQIIVYNRKWPRNMQPHEVSSAALREATAEGSGGASAAALSAAAAGHQGAYTSGLFVGVAHGATTYLKHSGRGHLRLVAGEAVPTKSRKRRKKVELRVVKNGRRAAGGAR